MVSWVKNGEAQEGPGETARKAAAAGGPLKTMGEAYRVPPGESARARNACIVLIDSRPLTRASISQLLAQGSPPQRRTGDFAVFSAASLDEFLAHPPYPADQIAMIAFNLGAHCPFDDHTPFDHARLQRHYPGVPLVILSDCENPAHILAALRDGVRGYIPTALEPAMVCQAIRLVLAGGVFIPPTVIATGPRAVQANGNGNGAAGGPGLAGSSRSAALGEFTPRQSEVFDLLRQGKSNKIIAYELGMQESTVKVHVRQIMRKLKALNRTHAAFLANQMSASGGL